MATIRRFQIDLTVEELNSIAHLGALAGLRTKKDVILNAITLFRWAAREILYGRTICSIDERTQVVKQLELPALSTIIDKRVEPLTESQIQERIAEGTRQFKEFATSPTGGTNVSAVSGTLETTGPTAVG